MEWSSCRDTMESSLSWCETRFAHGNVGGATYLLLGFRQNLYAMENEPSNTTVHDDVSAFRRDGGLESGRIVEWLRRRLVHQGRDFRPHSGNCERHHPEQRTILGRDAGRGQIQTKSAKAGDFTEVSADTGIKDASPHWSVPFGKILGRARHLGARYSFNGSNKTEIDCRLKAIMANWAALRPFWFARSPWSHRRLISCHEL